MWTKDRIGKTRLLFLDRRDINLGRINFSPDGR
jgi:hypothetical protein